MISLTMGLSGITRILCLALSLWLQSAWAFETVGETTIYDAPPWEYSAETALDSTSTTITTSTTQPTHNGLDPNASSVSLWEEFKPWWIALLITWGLCCLFVVCWRASRQRQRTQEKNKVFSLFRSLQGLDAEDLHIRHSPMGGFHVSYTNNLIHTGGNNTPPQSSQESSSLDSEEDDLLLSSKRPFKGDEDTAKTSLSLVL